MDPAAERLAERERARNGDTFSELAESYWKAASTASRQSRGNAKAGDTNTRLAPEMGLAINLLMLTLTRRSEVAGARWAEFDMTARHWTIPGDRAKAKHLHVVPLTDRMLEILAQARAFHPTGTFVFPALKGSKDHLDARAITRAFARICDRHELSAGSPHDVRRSGATTLIGRYGVSRLVVGMLLGHTAGEGAAVTSVYDRHAYLPEKRQALEMWSDHLVAIETASPSSHLS